MCTIEEILGTTNAIVTYMLFSSSIGIHGKLVAASYKINTKKWITIKQNSKEQNAICRRGPLQDIELKIQRNQVKNSKTTRCNTKIEFIYTYTCIPPCRVFFAFSLCLSLEKAKDHQIFKFSLQIRCVFVSSQ